MLITFSSKFLYFFKFSVVFSPGFPHNLQVEFLAVRESTNVVPCGRLPVAAVHKCSGELTAQASCSDKRWHHVTPHQQWVKKSMSCASQANLHQVMVLNHEYLQFGGPPGTGHNMNSLIWSFPGNGSSQTPWKYPDPSKSG